jgi:hypothetical protein
MKRKNSNSKTRAIQLNSFTRSARSAAAVPTQLVGPPRASGTARGRNFARTRTDLARPDLPCAMLNSAQQDHNRRKNESAGCTQAARLAGLDSGRRPREKREMLPATEHDHFLDPRLEPQEKFPVGHRSGLREPNRLPEKLANRTVFIGAKIERRIGSNGSRRVQGGSNWQRRLRDLAAMVAIFVAAGILPVAARIVPLARQ